jgi:hypothetical protein
MQLVHEVLHQLGRRRRALLLQAAAMAGSGVALVIGAGGLDGAPLDLQFLFLSATGLFSLAAIQLVDELCGMLGTECPRCADRFFGRLPEHLPWPLRRRCSHCGLGLLETSAPPSSSQDLG